MKVTTNTPALLIVEDRPVVIAVALIVFTLAFVGFGLFVLAEGEWLGALFLVLGGGMGIACFAIFVRRVQVVFHRVDAADAAGAYVELRRRTVFGASKVRHPLSEVSHAELESSRSSDGPDTHRVVLVISEGQSAGRHPITFAYSSGSGHQRCKEAINDWLSDRTA